MITRRQVVGGAAALVSCSALARGSVVASEGAALSIVVPGSQDGGLHRVAGLFAEAARAEKFAGEVNVEALAGPSTTVAIPRFAARYRGTRSALLLASFAMLMSLAQTARAAALQPVPLVRLTAEPFAVVVPPSSEMKSLADLLLRLKADPRRVTLAGGNPGGLEHVAASLLVRAADANPRQLAWTGYASGVEALDAALQGRVMAAVLPAAEVVSTVAAGRLRALAVTNDARLAELDAPTTAELGIPVVVSNWLGLFAAPGLAEAELAALAGQIEPLARLHSLQAALRRDGWIAAPLNREVFGPLAVAEVRRLTQVRGDLALPR